MTVTLSGSAATSGIQKYQYSTDGEHWQDLTATQSTSATTIEPYNAEEAQWTVSASTNSVCQFRAVSNAGGVSDVTTLDLRVDKTAPTITADGDTTHYRTDDTVTLTVSAGLSGIAQVEVVTTAEDITGSYEDGYPVTENGTYTFRITNGAGATAETSITYTKLDAAKPTLTLNTNGYAEGTWATGDVTLTATASQNVAPVTVEYKTDGDWQTLDGDLIVSTDTPGTTYTFRPVSASGVTGDETSVTVKRDASSPEGTVTIGENAFKKLIHDITFGLFFKESTEVTFSGSDATSGVASLEYVRSETLLTEEELLARTDWTEYSGPISETAEDAKAFVYYGKVTDKAGNTTLFGADGVIFDTAAPSFAGVTDGGTYYTTQTVTVTDVNVDTLTLNGEPVTSPVTLPGDTDATYTLTATDKAGNEAQITVTMRSFASLETPVAGLTPDNVTSADKAALEETLDKVSGLLQSGAPTEEEKNKLEATQSKIEEMLDTLDKAQSAGSTENTDKVAAVTPDNVKPGDREDLEAAKQDLETALEDYGGNYTEEEKAPLEEALNRIDAALESLDKVQAVQDAVAALPDTVAPDDAQTAEKVEAAQDLLDRLTDHEKELLGTAAGEKLNELLAQAAAYRILSGDKSTWTLGGADGLTVTANGSPNRLTEMQLDGKTLAPENYTVRTGSTVVILAPGYLNSLATGTHTLTFVYENGQTSATFTVAPAPSGSTDNTGSTGSTGSTSSDSSTGSTSSANSASSDSSTGGASSASDSESGADSAATGASQSEDAGSLPLWLCLVAGIAVLCLVILLVVKRKRKE